MWRQWNHPVLTIITWNRGDREAETTRRTRPSSIQEESCDRRTINKTSFHQTEHDDSEQALSNSAVVLEMRKRTWVTISQRTSSPLLPSHYLPEESELERPPLSLWHLYKCQKHTSHIRQLSFFPPFFFSPLLNSRTHNNSNYPTIIPSWIKNSILLLQNIIYHTHITSPSLVWSSIREPKNCRERTHVPFTKFKREICSSCH